MKKKMLTAVLCCVITASTMLSLTVLPNTPDHLPPEHGITARI